MKKNEKKLKFKKKSFFSWLYTIKRL